MASEEKRLVKNKFQQHWDMYQSRLAAASASNIPNTTAPNEQPATTPGNGSTSVAASHAAQVGPITVGPAKTFEQVYKDVLEKEFGIAEGDASRSHAAPFVGEPKPSSSKKKDEYITTVYNITPRELPAAAVNRHVTPTGTILLNGAGLSEAAKRSAVGQFLPSSPAVQALAILPVVNLPNSSQKQIFLQQNPLTSDHAKAQQEIYRRIQLKQQQQSHGAANSTPAGNIQTTDAIMVSKHHTNVMLAIVKPKITTPAPAHVYGAPDVNSAAQQNPPPPQQYSPRLQLTENHRMQHAGNAKVTVEYINEPPPAHRALARSPKPSFSPTKSTAPSITPKPAPNGHSQDEALNLDTKYDAGGSREVVPLIVVPAASDMAEQLMHPATAILRPSGEGLLLVAPSTGTKEQLPSPTSSTVMQNVQQSLLKTSPREAPKQPASGLNQNLKEILMVTVPTSAREPIKQAAVLTNSAQKESILPSTSSSTSGTLKQPNRQAIITNPSSKECFLATVSSSMQTQPTCPNIITNLMTKESLATNSVKERVKQPSPMVQQNVLESLLRTAATSAIGQLNQTAIVLNQSTNANPLTSISNTQQPLQQATVTHTPTGAVNQGSKQSNISRATPSTSLQLPIKQSTDPVTNSGTILSAAGASCSTASSQRELPNRPTVPTKPMSTENGNTRKNKVQNVVTGVPSGSIPIQANAAFWEQLQKLNIQHLLTQVLQANKISTGGQVQPSNPTKKQNETSAQPTVVPLAVNSPMAITKPPQQPTLVQHTVGSFPSPMSKADYEQAIFQRIEAMKRKNITPLDPTKKRRSNTKPKRPTEAFLQNGPCYEVASRLPRCRECGRSRAARSRNASLIFCRFFAFRKLKYNNMKQLEVYGFADPVADAKDADTSLWSANLRKVPADLTVEKSKFLLGQVGYKFCELFHQEKEAYFEHMSEDKTVAWKQAVHGVREMCDVCQTTLFNHHWVCSACGFVVCIDCYMCRKNGIVTVKSTAKDMDANGWLLCSATKEPHEQSRLMLTQIIPSKCLYTLVRQMHGICALLEIPLNCACPLTREPLLRTIKDQLKFIYPIEPTALDPAGGEVSVTIKHLEQVGSNGRTVECLSGSNDPFECRIVFTQQYQQFREHQNSNQWGEPFAQDESNESCREKQSYSFDGFEQEIHADGDHFDERLYKSSTVSKAASKPNAQGDAEDGSKAMVDSSDEESDVLGTSSSHSFIMKSDSEHDISTVKQETNGAVQKATPNGASTGGVNGSQQSSESAAYLKHESVQQPVANGNGSNDGTTAPPASEAGHEKQKKPYSEEARFKAAPPVDQKTVTMIIKQVVKTDKSIFQLMAPHMMGTSRHQLNDFAECLSVQRERVRKFVADFLDEFIFLRGQNSNDDLANDRVTVDYNRSMREGGDRYRNKPERKMNLLQSKTIYPDVAHQWLCNGKLLRLLDPLDVHNYRVFHDQWERGQPVMVSAVSSKMNMDLWMPASFGRDFGDQMNDLINCLNGKIVRGHPMRVFWEGFEEISERLVDERERPMMLKLKDWPPGDDFAEMMPSRFYDLMKSLPLAEYTRREGRLNLASRLSSFFVRPDLGPKMYSAYGSALHPTKGTTNLHLDISDAVNVMVYVGVPKDVPSARYNEKIVELIDSEDCDYLTRQRVRERKELPGALWHIYHAQDADKIRALLNRIEIERGGTIKPNHDPIHDQKWYLDRNMRKRLQQEYHVEGYAIVQCAGDAIFIPAGAPHQVRNLHNCIKVAEDFVSPENISHCLKLTNEFRHLSGTHSNHEDKLQIKNIIYHTVKDAVSCITNPLISMAARGEAKKV